MMNARVKKMTAPRMHHVITHLGFTSAVAMTDLLTCIQKGLEETVKAIFKNYYLMANLTLIVIIFIGSKSHLPQALKFVRDQLGLLYSTTC